MTSINYEVHIIPAQLGWSVATAGAGDTKLDKDPVIAWSVEWDDAYDTFEARPITYNTGRNSLSSLEPGYVLSDPFGNFASMWEWGKNHPETMQTEEEAVKHCIDEKANCEGGVAVYTPVSCAQGGQR